MGKCQGLSIRCAWAAWSTTNSNRSEVPYGWWWWKFGLPSCDLSRSWCFACHVLGSKTRSRWLLGSCECCIQGRCNLFRWHWCSESLGRFGLICCCWGDWENNIWLVSNIWVLSGTLLATYRELIWLQLQMLVSSDFGWCIIIKCCIQSLVFDSLRWINWDRKSFCDSAVSSAKIMGM